MNAKKDNVQIVVKPIGPFGGLDRIHFAMVAVILIMIALLLVISGSKVGAVGNYSQPTNVSAPCAYQYQNGTCTAPVHNQSQVLAAASKIIASYNYVNNSLSLLPYLTNIRMASAYYIAELGQWYVLVPSINPYSGNTFYVAFSIYDKNLTANTAYMQTEIPSVILNDSVASLGVINLYDKFSCTPKTPVQVFWFIDPYAQGSISSIRYAEALQERFGKNVSVSLKILSGRSTTHIASQYGAANAQELGRYLLCASAQGNFSKFEVNLNSAFSGGYISGSMLSSVASRSGIDLGTLSACMANASATLNAQALLAQYYNVTATPITITDCKYMALPQTTQNAVCYADPKLCSIAST
jgi:hypothetical protein